MQLRVKDLARRKNGIRLKGKWIHRAGFRMNAGASPDSTNQSFKDQGQDNKQE